MSISWTLLYQIVSSLHRKDTAKNSLLHANSAHPMPLKHGLPYSQFLRLHRICSGREDFEAKAQSLYMDFKSRGYPNKWLDTALEKVSSLQKQEEINLTMNKRNRNFSCIFKSTYSPLSNDIKTIIKNHWHIIQSDPQLLNVFSDQPLFVSSRSSNLRDKLVHADTYISSPTTLVDAQGNFPCHSCSSCTEYVKCKSFTHPRTLKTYKIRQLITCKSTYVIYIIICPCSQLYVGKTTRALRTRMIEHTSAIRRQDDTSSISRNFKFANHSLSDMKFLGIERILPHRRGGDRKLLQREAFWIFELKSLFPEGMNEELEFSCFL